MTDYPPADSGHPLVGRRVRHRTLGYDGTIVAMLPTPNFGSIPLVRFGEDDVEPCGWGEVELLERDGPHPWAAILDETHRMPPPPL